MPRRQRLRHLLSLRRSPRLRRFVLWLRLHRRPHRPPWCLALPFQRRLRQLQPRQQVGRWSFAVWSHLQRLPSRHRRSQPLRPLSCARHQLRSKVPRWSSPLLRSWKNQRRSWKNQRQRRKPARPSQRSRRPLPLRLHQSLQSSGQTSRWSQPLRRWLRQPLLQSRSSPLRRRKWPHPPPSQWARRPPNRLRLRLQRLFPSLSRKNPWRRQPRRSSPPPRSSPLQRLWPRLLLLHQQKPRHPASPHKWRRPVKARFLRSARQRPRPPNKRLWPRVRGISACL